MLRFFLVLQYCINILLGNVVIPHIPLLREWFLVTFVGVSVQKQVDSQSLSFWELGRREPSHWLCYIRGKSCQFWDLHIVTGKSQHKRLLVQLGEIDSYLYSVIKCYKVCHNANGKTSHNIVDKTEQRACKRVPPSLTDHLNWSVILLSSSMASCAISSKEAPIASESTSGLNCLAERVPKAVPARRNGWKVWTTIDCLETTFLHNCKESFTITELAAGHLLASTVVRREE